MQALAFIMDGLKWLNENRAKGLLGVIILLALILFRSCDDQAICSAQVAHLQAKLQSAEETIKGLEARASAGGTARTRVVVEPGKTVFVPANCPPCQECPKVTVDCEGSGKGDAVALVPLPTPMPIPVTKPIVYPNNSFSLGVGYFGSPYGLVGVEFGNLEAQLQGNGFVWGGDVAYKLLKW